MPPELHLEKIFTALRKYMPLAFDVASISLIEYKGLRQIKMIVLIFNVKIMMGSVKKIKREVKKQIIKFVNLHVEVKISYFLLLMFMANKAKTIISDIIGFPVSYLPRPDLTALTSF